MGMTDRQFDEYQKGLLRDLERVKIELKEENQTLNTLIKDIQDGLKRA